MALGRSPDIAINHDAVAIAMHKANHPHTRHLTESVYKVIPSEACGGLPVGLLWLSPDCKHFSKAKGARPVEKRIRGLAWIAIAWAKLPKWQRPRIIILENVEEFQTWGPLGTDGRPCPDRKGQEFDRWVRELKRYGYRVEHRELRACDYGAPTIRKRLFLIARCDRKPIVWPAPTHGDPKSEAVKSGKLKPWRTAAEIINWSLPCPSIFLSPDEVKALWAEQRIRVQRPLKPKTMERIAKGVFRYVINAAEPFIVPITHGGDIRVNDINEPLRTQTTAHRGEHALVTPFFAPRYQEKDGHDPRTRPADLPAATQVPGGNEGVLVTPFVTKFNRGATGHALDEPLHTITAAHSETHPGGASPLGIVMPYMIPRYGERDGQDPRTRSVEEPMPVIVPTGNEASLISPMLVGCGGRAGQSPPRPADVPARTMTAKADDCLVAAHLSRQFGASVGSSAEEPVGTITAGGGGKAALVTAFLAQHNYMEPGHDAREPLSTIVNRGCTQAVVSAGLLNLKGTDRRGGPIEAPTPAITAQGGHLAETRAFLIKYYGSGGQLQSARDPMATDTAQDRFGIVMVHGEPYQIVDIGMRMLTARERFNAQGFRPDYVIELFVEKKLKSGQVVRRKITGDEQGRMVGNSVSPVIPEALITANYAEVPVAGRGVPEFALQAAE
jgi:DNA (cytosine-5)-methyltransferase 1